ncbi:MAG: hypothetical protein AAF614_08585, partial [Chloroflexota bacterium]
GERLDEALRTAQQTYLKEAPLAKAGHPFYWAGFHLQGDLSPLDLKAGGFQWWSLLLAAALILLYLMVRRKYKSA